MSQHSLSTTTTWQRNIAEHEASVRAWAYLPDASAVSVPADSTQGVAGLPFGVKDVIDVAGMPTGCGSAAVDTAPRRYDAACVAQLRAAGAVPVGKTATAEFAFRAPGPTTNPHQPAHTPGGSSSGSAAAVAAGMIPFALSTQTGGSIVRPAAYCGVVGYKPSFGQVQRAGLTMTCDSLDVIGWHADSVAMARRVAQVLLPAPAPSQEDVPSLRDLRVAVMGGSPRAALEPDGRATLEQAVAQLARHGIANDRRVPRDALCELNDAHDHIMAFEFSRNLGSVATLAPGLVSDSLRDTVIKGRQVSGAQYRAARDVQRRLRHDWQALFGDAHIVLTPSAPGPAPRGLEQTGSPAFAKPWSILGWPCLHLPLGRNAEGLPLGLQIVGPWESDFMLLALGEQLHAVLSNKE